jgi:hypothetical protein
MRPLLFNREEELLLSRSGRSSRSGSRSSFFFLGVSFFGSFFLLLGRFGFFLCISSRSSSGSRSGSRSSSRLGGISSENNCREGNGYEGGYDCGQNFFHLYYLQRECV